MLLFASPPNPRPGTAPLRQVRKVFYKDFLVEIETENQARLFRAKEKYEEELLEWETNNAVEYDMAKQDWEDACDAVAAEKSRREEEAATRWRAACRETAEYNQALDEIVEYARARRGTRFAGCFSGCFLG